MLRIYVIAYGKLPVNGWERKVSTKLYEGKDIGWK